MKTKEIEICLDCPFLDATPNCKSSCGAVLLLDKDSPLFKQHSMGILTNTDGLMPFWCPLYELDGILLTLK